VTIKPFLKWAGGKRWLLNREEFQVPPFDGKYIEPFLGGGAVFFHNLPSRAILADLNTRLIETYVALRDNWEQVWRLLSVHQGSHSKNYYYLQRELTELTVERRAAQFLYLNRACWNGLYRENLRGKFNVPIGTKDKIIFESDDFSAVSAALAGIEIRCQDFETTIRRATEDDLLFLDPPYTVAHNMNGFVKYNEKMFSWDDQVRLSVAVKVALRKGANVVMTNADHASVKDLYRGILEFEPLDRWSVISGESGGRRQTNELLLYSRRSS